MVRVTMYMPKAVTSEGQYQQLTAGKIKFTEIVQQVTEQINKQTGKWHKVQGTQYPEFLQCVI